MASTELIKGILTLGEELDNNHGMGSVMIVDDMERLVVKYDKSKTENLPTANVSSGSIIIPKVMNDKNIKLSRALTYLSEDAEDFDVAKEIFNDLQSLMDE